MVAGEGLKLDIAGNARLTSLLRLRPHRRTCVRLKLVLNQRPSGYEPGIVGFTVKFQNLILCIKVFVFQ